jgi:membrane-bound metal-dependent hydrolase YbcI (DUF457 family)
MAGFKTHVTTSSLLGIGYGAVAHVQYQVPIGVSCLSAALCGVSGMLPDLDSDSGRPLRETIGFTASVVPMLLIHRLVMQGWSHDSIALAGIGVYAAIRFGMTPLLKMLTVHRGMFHSLPACLIAGEITYLICESETVPMRLFKAGAVMAGFMSHLLLDEIWSVDLRHGLPRLKSSFGTAIKFWGDAWGPNLFTYSLVGLLGFMVVQNPDGTGGWQQRLFDQQQQMAAPESPEDRPLEHVAGRDESIDQYGRPQR